jgi:hypothetical protein
MGWKYADGVEAMDNRPEGKDARVVRGGSFGLGRRVRALRLPLQLLTRQSLQLQGFRVVCSHVPG